MKICDDRLWGRADDEKFNPSTRRIQRTPGLVKKIGSIKGHIDSKRDELGDETSFFF